MVVKNQCLPNEKKYTLETIKSMRLMHVLKLKCVFDCLAERVWPYMLEVKSLLYALNLGILIS